MTTFLSALRFAVNVEHLLEERQKELFRSYGDTSAMFLPPLVPIVTTDKRPDLHDLDVFRKRHHLRVRPGSTSAHTEISGFPEMVSDFETQFGPVVTDTPFSGTTDSTARIVRLSWHDPEPASFPVHLPETSALWLSLFEIETGSGDQWWSGGSWALCFNRRFTNRPHPPTIRG